MRIDGKEEKVGKERKNDGKEDWEKEKEEEIREE